MLGGNLGAAQRARPAAEADPGRYAGGSATVREGFWSGLKSEGSPENHDGTIIPDTVDTMWGTDLTTIRTGERRFEALEPIRQGVRRHFGGFAKDIARGLAVRHDQDRNTCPSTSRRISRFSASRVLPPSSAPPKGNGCAERIIRTLKLLPGPYLRNHRGITPRSAGVPRHIQHDLADRAARLHQPSRIPTEPPSRCQTGGTGFNTVSRKPKPVHDSAPHLSPDYSMGLVAAQRH